MFLVFYFVILSVFNVFFLCNFLCYSLFCYFYLVIYLLLFLLSFPFFTFLHLQIHVALPSQRSDMRQDLQNRVLQQRACGRQTVDWLFVSYDILCSLEEGGDPVVEESEELHEFFEPQFVSQVEFVSFANQEKNKLILK